MSTTVLPFTLTIITIQYSDTMNSQTLNKKHFHDNYKSSIDEHNLLHFNYLIFLVCTVWACWKGMTLQKTLKKKSTNKNHCDDNYILRNSVRF